MRRVRRERLVIPVPLDLLDQRDHRVQPLQLLVQQGLREVVPQDQLVLHQVWQVQLALLGRQARLGQTGHKVVRVQLVRLAIQDRQVRQDQQDNKAFRAIQAHRDQPGQRGQQALRGQ